MDKNIRQLIILIAITVLLIVGTIILKNMNKESEFKWNYKEIDTAENILVHGNRITDRKVYWQLKDIVYDFLCTMQDEEWYEIDSDKENVGYQEYYKVLDNKYKRYLSKEDFDKVVNRFMNKFLLQDHLGYMYVGDFVIETILGYGKNKYLCVLNSDIDNNIGYIGIKLDSSESRFTIFYIE